MSDPEKPESKERIDWVDYKLLGEASMGCLVPKTTCPICSKGRDKVFVLWPNHIFVFGSNRAGIHGAGAARAAHQFYRAQWGLGEGLQGDSYAIPTKDENLKTLPLEDVAAHVAKFIIVANCRKDLYFFVTRIGCGLAGFTDEQIAPLFKDAPVNCELPEGWRPGDHH